MKGTIVTISESGQVSKAEVTSPHNILKDLEKAVGGFIESVPYFEHILLKDGDKQWLQPCAAFCNEHGKLEQMDVNHVAQSLWATELDRHSIPIDDVLVGPVAIVYGDEDFMREL